MPPDGKLDASGSPLTSSLPLNSATARPSLVGFKNAVVLLGGDAGQRLEPVRVVRGAVLDRPVLQRAGDDVGHRVIDRFAVRNGAAQRAEHFLRQPGALDFLVEGQRAEVLGRLARAERRRRSRRGGPVVMERIASPDDAEPIGSPFAKMPVQGRRDESEANVRLFIMLAPRRRGKTKFGNFASIYLTE